ncbi:S8 family serine peptidase [candidate division KSB1 bacterium]|nr:S8 family serine peptidase [candidate division KSB1 bacterium]
MKQRYVALFFILVFLTLPMMVNAAKPDMNAVNKAKPKIIPGEVIVKFGASTGNVESSSLFSRVLSDYAVEKAERMFPAVKFKSNAKHKVNDLSRIYQMKVDEARDVWRMCSELSSLPGIEYAEPSMLCPVEAIPNDQYYSIQWQWPIMQAEQAWDVAKGDSAVIIAILDTGVDWDHPDLAANIWDNKGEVIDGVDNDGNGYIDDVRGWDFVTGIDDVANGEDGDEMDNDPMDFDGHGTHVAGCASAITDNGIGVAAIGWGCTIMPLRCGYRASDGNGYLNFAALSQAYVYAADNGAHVASISTGSSQTVADAARYAFDAGLVITKSAGNDNDEDADPLLLQPFCISVAATDDQDLKASYSTYGDWVRVSAPGGDQSNSRPGILSTAFNNTYASYQGTSMASPIVAGLAGLVKSAHPDWSNVDVMMQIINTTDSIDDLNPAYAGKLGTGRVNAYRALTETPPEIPKIKLLSTRMDDSEFGNGNGLVEAGETIELIAEFENIMGTATNTVASLEMDDWAVNIINNVSNIGELKGLRDIDNNRIRIDADPLVFEVDSLALPHRISGAITISADGYENSYYFSFSIGASVLLVDDEALDNEKYYIKALDSLSVSYDYWNHNTAGTPDDLSGYSTVIWSCEWTFPSLDSTDRALIANYLDNGGNFFLSGQDIGWDLSDDQGTEFLASNGASRTFYENYLKAIYIADVSDYSNLVGVEGDPIGNGLAFNVYQPGRAADEQFPDVIEPIKLVSNDVFDYPGGTAGAVSYAGDYRCVYFGFGGYEAIVQPDVQFEVMSRILGWLNGLEMSHTPLKDTEDTGHDYKMIVNATAQAPGVGAVELYWDNDQQLPYNHKVALADSGNGKYVGYIPAQTAGTNVTYTVFVQTVAGYSAPYSFYKFKVGQDTEKPIFESVSQITNAFSKTGPYTLSANIVDNVGVNADSVRMFSILPNGTLMQHPMMPVGDNFEAQFSGQFNYGDTIRYYLSALDLAGIPNKGISDTLLFIVGYSNFEDGLVDWNVKTPGWGIETGDAHSGSEYASDSPMGNYVPGVNSSLQLKSALSFANADSVVLTFWSKYRIQPGKAFGYVEFSTDGGEIYKSYSKAINGIRPSWGRFEVPLGELAGEDSVLVRFRLEADSTGSDTYDGWMIDDVQVREFMATDVAAHDAPVQVPTEFALRQNYPNPFNPETSIQFQLKAASNVTIRVYNMMGQLVRTLVDAKHDAGYYMVHWDGMDQAGRSVSSGIYVYRMEAPAFVQTRKMLLLK